MIIEALIVINTMCETKIHVYNEKGTELTVLNKSSAKQFLDTLGLGYQSNILDLLGDGDVHNVLLGVNQTTLMSGETIRAVSFMAEAC